MEIVVRKNNVSKAVSLLNKRMAEDGDLRRYVERAHGFKSQGEIRRAAMAAAKIRARKDLQERLAQDTEDGNTRK